MKTGIAPGMLGVKTNSLGMHLRCDIVDVIVEVCRLQMEVDTEQRETGRKPRRAGRRERDTKESRKEEERH